jgi:hypothetical protein
MGMPSILFHKRLRRKKMDKQPAFPVAYGGGCIEGMTLRDYFAAKASEEDVAAYRSKGHYKTEIRTAPDGAKHEVQVLNMFSRAEAKYRYADAMMEARK